MRAALYVAALVAALLLAGCAATSPYASDVPMGAGTFRTRDGGLTGRVPRGWSSQARDSLAPALGAWLIRDDAGASMAFRELALDDVSARAVRDDGLELLARLSAGFRLRSGIEPKMFESAGKKFCAYETGEGNARTRVVVFAARGRYYECEAKAVKGRWSADDFARLFSAQQSLLPTLSF